MRYYRIVITDPATNEILIPNYNNAPGFTRVKYDGTQSTYTSLNSGASVTTTGGTNLSAQLVELDIASTYMHAPIANSFVKIYGVGLAEISQAQNLNGLNISIYGGMAKGLPLANPAQAALLCSGQVWQAFGNWIGNEQTLNVYVYYAGSSPSSAQTTGNAATFSTVPAPASNAQPGNFIFTWEPGQTLINAIMTTLSKVFPKYQIQGAINANLVKTGSTASGFYANFQQFATDMQVKSLAFISGYAPDGSYAGVQMSLQNGVITIQDGSTQTKAKQIQAVDLLGQVTWAEPYKVQATCVLRGDINVGDYVTLPNLPGITTAGSSSQYYASTTSSNSYASVKTGSIFTGTFQVYGVRHVGNSRSPDATAWATALDLGQVSASKSSVSAYPTLYTGNSSYTFYLPG